MIWTQLDPRVAIADAVGLLPLFVSDTDPRGAREQFETNYIGGWRDSKVGKGGFSMIDDGKLLPYPGDLPLHALAQATLRDETIIVYQSAYVAVVQKDGSFRVSRLD